MHLPASQGRNGLADSYELGKRSVAKLRQADSPLAHRIEVQPAEDVHIDFEAATVA
jgi:hypothetical protein